MNRDAEITPLINKSLQPKMTTQLLGGCDRKEYCWALIIKKKAWLALATARSIINNKCFRGGDSGHRQAEADAWTNVGKCEKAINTMSLQMISRDKIRRAFPPERTPNTIPLVESAQGIDEEMMETADVFRGKHWDELTAKDFAPDVSFMGFLTYAWQWYYLPALICCSLEELQTVGYLSDTDMAVDSIISILDSFTYPECNAVENMRKIFSKEQAIIVKDWIYLLTLSTNDIPVHADHLIIFLEKYAIGAYFKR